MWDWNHWIQQKTRHCHHQQSWSWINHHHPQKWNLCFIRRNQKQGSLIRYPQQQRSLSQGIKRKRRCWLRHQISLISWSRWSLRINHWKTLHHCPTWRQCWSCLSWISQNRRIKPNYGFSLNLKHLLKGCPWQSYQQTRRIEIKPRNRHWRRQSLRISRLRRIWSLISWNRNHQKDGLISQIRCWSQT